MDKKTAFEILNLEDSVSFEDAKKAYRNLAKKYHPDIAEKNSWSDNAADERMKEINLAFRYLAPRLRLIDKRSEKTKGATHEKISKQDKSMKHEKEIFFSNLSKMFGAFFHTFRKKENPRDFKNRSKKDKPLSTPCTQAKTKKPCFDDIFQKLNQGQAYLRVTQLQNNY